MIHQSVHYISTQLGIFGLACGVFDIRASNVGAAEAGAASVYSKSWVLPFTRAEDGELGTK